MDKPTKLLLDVQARLRASHPGFGWITAQVVDSLHGRGPGGMEIWVEAHGEQWQAYIRGSTRPVAECRFDRPTPEEAVQAAIESPPWQAGTRRAA